MLLHCINKARYVGQWKGQYRGNLSLSYSLKRQQVQPRNVSKIPYILDELKLSEAVKKLGPGSSKQRQNYINQVRQYDPNITHGEVDAAFEGMKGATRRELDEHIRGVHDPLQGVYRNEAMSDQSLGINARANELANDIGIHTLPQPSLRAIAPPNGINKEDDLKNFMFGSHQEKEKEKVKKKDNINQNQGIDNTPDAKTPYATKKTGYYMNEGGQLYLQTKKDLIRKEDRLNRPPKHNNYMPTNQLQKSLEAQKYLKNKYGKNKKKKS
ncbi:MAG: hypothetical protein EZS28_034734 [Streblomastix strix]|uniref:Uncharacterized protein n=1 Tax=Streblomastix strix TaxID=222440 RepID=A0A5J4UGN5_9EUKA|nr:MAG: hypothetical protein EZS28_034734 [Streblomastix strix]